MLIRDTSMVSEIAVEQAIILLKHGIERFNALQAINTAYKYPKGTMESYFGKLSAKAKRRKKEAELARTPSFL